MAWQRCFGGSENEFLKDLVLTNDGGYAFTSYTQSNDGDVSGLNGNVSNNIDYWVVKVSSNNDLQWQTCLGGTGEDIPRQMVQTSDGGFLIGGYSSSTNFDVTGNHGNTDIWVVKLDANGAVQWRRCYGGSPFTGGGYNGYEFLSSISQTSDGGYILSGITNSSNFLIGDPNSYNGDVNGLHETFSPSGSYDIWIVRLNSSGNILWQRCLGGTKQEQSYSIMQTSDGGFISIGQTRSNNGDVIGIHATDGQISSGLISTDIWIVKLDAAGNILWQRCLGGTNDDTIYNYYVSNLGAVTAFSETSDFGFILIGSTVSNNDGDVSGHHGNMDVWVVKLDVNGSIEWQKCLGGSAGDSGTSIVQTTDGGFLGCGGTNSSDGDVTGYHMGWNESDIWVFKLDPDGNLEWQKCLGGSGTELPSLARQTIDGNYIVAGITNGGYYIDGSPFSNDGDVIGFHGGWDFWTVGLNDNGQIQWQKCLGGSENEGALGANLTFTAEGCTFKLADNGDIVFAGSTASNDGDVSGNHSDFFDIWVAGLSSEMVSDVNSENEDQMRLYPNPASENLIFWVDENEIGGSFYIYDGLGRIVLCDKVLAVKNYVSLVGISPGVYTLKAENRKSIMLLKK
jgi:hypothetical protein